MIQYLLSDRYETRSPTTFGRSETSRRTCVIRCAFSESLKKQNPGFLQNPGSSSPILIAPVTGLAGRSSAVSYLAPDLLLCRFFKWITVPPTSCELK
ncbi:hypothetical protein CEXT_309671 [Caerostris extrusa]|uniref:Uncharacterized protein n=1 Tax=Caerostris extrusa TaxID=172846 RepID=A0AAV4NF46_CAEEX|nr:hypothetical protein CEXT_309671 [Caerostris extrusa]